MIICFTVWKFTTYCILKNQQLYKRSNTKMLQLKWHRKKNFKCSILNHLQFGLIRFTGVHNDWSRINKLLQNKCVCYFFFKIGSFVQINNGSMLQCSVIHEIANPFFNNIFDKKNTNRVAIFLYRICVVKQSWSMCIAANLFYIFPAPFLSTYLKKCSNDFSKTSKIFVLQCLETLI